MRKIYVGFSKPKKFAILSWLIRVIQKTPYSHVYHKFYSNSYNRNIIYQASGLQVNFVGEQLFKEHCEVIEEFEFEVTDETYSKMMIFAIDKAGYPYSMKQLFRILIYMLTGIKTLKDGRSAYICAEMEAELLKEYLNISIDIDLDLVTPKDIYKILKRIKNGTIG